MIGAWIGNGIGNPLEGQPDPISFIFTGTGTIIIGGGAGFFFGGSLDTGSGTIVMGGSAWVARVQDTSKWE